MCNAVRKFVGAIPGVVLFGFSIAFTVPVLATDTPAEGSMGSRVFRAECPTGSYLVGFSGRTGAWIDQIAPVCAPLSADGKRLGKYRVGKMIGASAGGKADFATCPEHEIVVLTQHLMTIGDEGQSKFVGSISVTCFTTTGDYGGLLTGKYSGDQIVFGQRGSVIDDLDNPLHTSQCPRGEYARGFHGRSGNFINAFGLICGPLAPAKPGAVSFSPPKNSTSAFPTAPTIVSPQGFIIKGKGVFKITPSKHLTGTQAHVQLRWLNPPAEFQGKGLDFYQYTAPMNLIAGPYGIDAPWAQFYPGTWEMRVRINEPKVSDWSDWKRFEYYTQNPAATTFPKSGPAIGAAGGATQTPRGAAMLNPQPLSRKASGPATQRGDAVMLNPQPLPPKAVGPVTKPGEARMLNPQPLPPKSSDARQSPGGAVMLNPQPLPPKAAGAATNPGGATMLNPQPLPPKAIGPATQRGDAVMLNPQPLPPKAAPEVRQ